MSEHGHRLEKKLVKDYVEIESEQLPRELKHKKTKEQLFDYQPAPVPFIGSQFDEPRRKKVLVYASAERFSWVPEDEEGTKDRLRHRLHDKGDKLFRQVHIEPISNGGLLTVARYLLHRFKGQGHANCEFSKKPREFIEEIAVANFGKFSLLVRTEKGKKKNQDYASHGPTLAHSLRYVAKDLEALKPDLLILPYTIYNALGERRRKCLFEDHGNILIVGYLQFAGRNRHFLPKLASGSELPGVDWLERDWIEPCGKMSKGKGIDSLLRRYLMVMSSWDDLPEKAPLLIGFPPTSPVVSQWNSIHRPQAGCG